QTCALPISKSQDRRAGAAHGQRRGGDRGPAEDGQRLLRARRLRRGDGGGDPEGQEEDSAVRGVPRRPVRRERPVRRRARQAGARGCRAGDRNQADTRRAGRVRQVRRRRARAGRQAQDLARMREVHVSAIADAVKKLCMDANFRLEPDMLRAFDRALGTERSAAGKQVLTILKQNAEMARTRRIPYCLDTGMVICFVELGQDVHVTGGALYDAINEGVRHGYQEGYLRASIVRSPFDRVNTGDNTPAVIHVDVVPGATLKIMLMAKGGGCENRSKYTMLTPAAG